MGSKKAPQIAFDCDPRTPDIATPRDTIAIAEFGAVSTQKSVHEISCLTSDSNAHIIRLKDI